MECNQLHLTNGITPGVTHCVTLRCGDLSGERESTVANPHEVGKEGANTPDAHMSPIVARKEGVAVGRVTAIAVGVEVTGTAVDTGPEPEKDPLVDRLVADAVRTATKGSSHGHGDPVL